MQNVDGNNEVLKISLGYDNEQMTVFLVWIYYYQTKHHHWFMKKTIMNDQKKSKNVINEKFRLEYSDWYLLVYTECYGNMRQNSKGDLYYFKDIAKINISCKTTVWQ